MTFPARLLAATALALAARAPSAGAQQAAAGILSYAPPDLYALPAAPAAPAAADTVRPRSAAATASPATKRIETRALADGAAVVLDGRLDEPVWREAGWTSDFLQKEPDQGAAPTERTEVAFAYDEDALYVGARMYSDDPNAIGRVMAGRDDDGNAERIVVSLDTYHDRRTAYTFGVTASGVRLDWLHPEDDEANTDKTFNPVWVARTALTPEGWTAEMRIPFSQLRFTGRDAQVWGVNVQRVIPARNETVYWVYVPRDETGWASRFGELAGIERIRPSRRLEVMPYVAGDARVTSEDLIDPDNPLEDGREGGASTGADLKMGLGPSLTLDATINPDFGQVEADPAQVNLSDREIFFDERRPFFTEGARFLGAIIYADGQASDPQNYFYTRRIGGPPHGIPQGDFVDVPPQSSIVGAAKLTGRLPSGLAVGAFAAVTGEEHGRAYDLSARTLSEVAVEPVTAFGVTRLQQQFGPAGSTLALMLTGVRRDLPDGGLLADLLPRNAYAGGLDWNLRFAGGAYDLKGHLGFSHVAGDSLAIARVQRSPVRYFQRPDQDHVSFDPSRTSLTGGSLAMRLRKVSGGHWRGEAGVWFDSPEFEINDVGRVGRADDIAFWGNVRWREDQPGALFRNYTIGLHGHGNTSFGGVRRFTRIFNRTGVTWNNFWETYFELGRVPEWTSDEHTRGGPLMGLWSAWDGLFEVFGNRQAPLRWNAGLFWSASSFDTSSFDLWGEAATQIGNRWRLSIKPRYSHGTAPRQFVATREGGRDETFGRRYIFAYNENSELAAQVRVNYAFTPDLGLELYAEPFASSGRYTRFGELPEPGSRDLRAYGVDDGTLLERDEDGNVLVSDGEDAFTLEDPDFNVVSFRSNLLLRWEWRPGSTLFLVWQQNKSDSESRGDLVEPGSLVDALGASGENVLALKVTYWLPIL